MAEFTMNEAKVKEYWDKNVTDNYVVSGVKHLSLPFFEFGSDAEIQRVIEAAALTAESTILELGCGSGRVTIPLSKRVKHITAVDFSPNQLNQLKNETEKQGITNIDFVLSNALDFTSKNKFDVIYLNSFLQYLDDAKLQELLKTLVDMLSEGGQIICKDTFSALNRYEVNSDDYFSLYRTSEGYTSIFLNNGFTNIKFFHGYFSVYDLIFLRLGIKTMSANVSRLLKLLEPYLIKFYMPIIYLYKFLTLDKPALYQAISIWKKRTESAFSYTDIVSFSRPLSFLSYLNNRCASWMAYHLQHLKFSANFVTLMSFVISLVGIISLGIYKNALVFILCLVLAYTLDNLDGIWARVKSQQSELGAFLDKFFDTVKEYLIDLGFLLFYLKDLEYLFGNLYNLFIFLYIFLITKSVFFIFNDLKSWYEKNIRIITITPAEKNLILAPLASLHLSFYCFYYLALLLGYVLGLCKTIKSKYRVSGN